MNHPRMRALFCSVMLLSITCTSYGFIPSPTLSLPVNASTVSNFETQFVFNSVSAAKGYQIQYDTSNGFGSMLMRKDTTSTPYLYSVTLLKGKKYFWRARAFKPGDTSAWSATQTFTVFSKYTLFQPANYSSGTVKACVGNFCTTFRNATYIFEADTSPGFGSPLHVVKSSQLPRLIDTPLFQFGNSIYWRGTAVSENGDTLDWSDRYQYTIYRKPSITAAGSPAFPSTVLSWPTTDLAETILQLDTSVSFSSPVLFQKTLAPSRVSDTIRELRFGKRYYYRIRAAFDMQLSDWSDVQTFNVYAGQALTQPASHETLTDLYLHCSWNRMNGANVQLQLALDSLYSQILKDTVLADPLYVYDYPGVLDLNKRYFIRIRYVHAKDTSVWSENTIKTYDGQLSVSSPYHNQQLTEIRPRFLFKPATWATFHVLEIDTGTYLSEVHSPYYIRVSSFGSLGSYAFIDTTLRYNQRYVCRVYAISGNDTAAPSYSVPFYTPAAPQLYYPPDQSVGVGTKVSALVTGINGSTWVQWELDTSFLFHSSEYVSGTDVHQADSFDLAHIELSFPNNRLFKRTYYWRARCINAVDTGEWSTVFRYTTTTDPIVTAPVNGSTNVPTSPTLKWSIQGSASDYRYQYQLSTNSNFSNASVVTLPADESPEVTVNCNYQTQYYWRARATHARDTSAWTSTASFKTEDAPVIYPPMLVAPENQRVNIPVAPLLLQWTQTAGATGYEVQLGADANFTTIIQTQTVSGTSTSISLAQSHYRYYWRVRGVLKNVLGAWSATFWFESGGAVGVSEAPSDMWYSIFPNPVISTMYLHATEPVTLKVVDVKGTCVYSEDRAATDHELTTLEWNKGMYFLQIRSEKGMIVRKFVVQ